MAIRLQSFVFTALLAFCIAMRPGFAGTGDAMAQGEALLEKKDYQGALAAFDSVIRSSHGTAPAYIDRGLTYRKLQQDQKAIDDFTKAIQLEPEHSPAYFYRGSANLVQGHYKEAISDLTSATGIDPSESAILLTRASAYIGLGLSREAMADIEAARKLAKKQHPTYHMQVSNAGDSSGRGPGRLRGSLIADIDDFGAIEAGYLLNSVCGLKTVGFGEQFYVVGERNESLFNKPAGNSNSPGAPSPPSSGWLKWRTNLARVITQNWPAEYPAQAQALLKVTNRGDTSIEWLSYVPGANKQNRIATTLENPKAQQLFQKSVEKVVAGLSHSKELTFPAGSTATEILALAHFVSDYNLYVTMDDLTLLDGLPDSEKSVRIARICSMLDTEQVYEISDHFRKQLPANLQHHFIRDGARRHLIAVWPDLWFFHCPTELKPANIPSESRAYVESFIDHCLANRQYVKAEIAAKYLSWAAYSDRIFQKMIEQCNSRPNEGSRKMAADLEKQKLCTLGNLRTKLGEIDNDMRKPKERFVDGKTPLNIR